ncbi:MFS transporter [Stappia taiwanensis]|uniref:MFS transporter n=1 Tax=Stappia taiwanensis TaxID=992267 RepID=UPI00199CA6B4|nr:MFS transporter [Stappia taiwanensis]GGE80985.1 MFS transporter [Stappia taiwanensis]
MISERTRVISALGLVMILTWGSTFYLLAVLSGPIQDETGWSAGEVTLGISLGLLVSGLAASRIGSLIQLEGGRRVLAAGTLLIAAGLALLGLAHSLTVYLIAWGILGLGMAAALYDAAFSTLGRLYGREARSAITALTLWGGFASTVCWPISAFLVENVGWRGTCFAYAALHLTVTLPLCWYALPAGAPPVPAPSVSATVAPDRSPGRFDLRFWCIACAGSALAMLASLWSVHLITILTAKGYALAAAVGLGTLIGPAQVGARVLEMLGRGRHHPIWTMLVSTSLVLIGFVGLQWEFPAGAALVAYGAGNGLWSIARGALPLAVFAPEDYARIMGRLARPALIASALAPLLGAMLIDAYGPHGLLGLLALGALVPLGAALVLAVELSRRARSPALH